MHLVHALITAAAFLTACHAQSTLGIEALVRRRMQNHADSFAFSLKDQGVASANLTHPPNDEYTISNGENGTIAIFGNSPIALASGLRWYLTKYVHVDLYWFIGSGLRLAPQQLPRINGTYHGSSIVPW